MECQGIATAACKIMRMIFVISQLVLLTQTTMLSDRCANSTAQAPSNITVEANGTAARFAKIATNEM